MLKELIRNSMGKKDKKLDSHDSLTKAEFREMVENVIQEGLKKLKEDKTFPKVICNKSFLEQLRAKHIPEEYLKICVINYDQLNQ